ncbi:MAG: YgcG family protein [Pseudomonadota bacterium]
MFRRLLAIALLPLCVNAWGADSSGLVPVPALKARVTDLTQTLSAAQASALEQKLAAFEAQKGSQIAVLIVPTTQPEELEQYSIRVVDAWKLGRAKIDDGALLILAKNDRRMRIEVGRGLEGAMPDAIAKRIIAERVAPHFRQGDFAGGINAGVDQMIAVVSGEALPPPAQRAKRQGNGDSKLGALLVPFFILWGLGHILKRAMGTAPASGLVGVGTGLVAMLIIGSLGFAILAAVIAMFASLVMYSGAIGGMPMGYGGGGGGFGGGGFGGGGGGFGGGGASGDW